MGEGYELSGHLPWPGEEVKVKRTRSGDGEGFWIRNG